MLTETDFTEINDTLKVLRHVSEEGGVPRSTSMLGPNKMTLNNYIAVALFFLKKVQEIFYTQSGKPKSVMALVFDIKAIVTFIREIVRMFNKHGYVHAHQMDPITVSISGKDLNRISRKLEVETNQLKQSIPVLPEGSKFTEFPVSEKPVDESQ